MTSRGRRTQRMTYPEDDVRVMTQSEDDVQGMTCRQQTDELGSKTLKAGGLERGPGKQCQKLIRLHIMLRVLRWVRKQHCKLWRSERQPKLNALSLVLPVWSVE